MTTWYRTGTIAVTNGSTTVTGTGTAWVENTRIGDALHAPDGRVYEVANVVSDTSLTLASNFLGSTASGQDYAIQPTRGVIASFRDTVQTWISSIQSYIDGALAGRFGDGTASEPGVSFANDIDTGLRRSGSNELRVVSGGSDRVTINSSGNVGIGTTAPETKLHVLEGSENKTWTPGSAYVAIFERAADNVVAIVAANTASSQLRLGDVDDEDVGAVIYDHTSNYMSFRANSGERLRIDSSGNVGIGTTSPAEPLHLETSGWADILLNSTSSTNTVGGRIFFANENEFYSQTQIQGSPSALTTIVSGSPRMHIDSTGNVGIGTTSPGATLDVNGSLSKNSGSFKIDHPLPALSDTHYLVHSFVEGPRADNIYRGRVVLVGGAAAVDLDDAAGMTSGTFEALNGDVQVWVQNEDGWEPVRGELVGATLTITCRDGFSTDTVSWLVIAERQDQHMLDTQWTDEYGRVKLEPLKPIIPEEEPIIPEEEPV